MDAAVERALEEADELELETSGRASARPHTVRLRFAYADGAIWLRTGERPPAADASGVRRRSGAERSPDWLRNIERRPEGLVRVGGAVIPVRYVPSPDPAADLRRVVELLREKYGPDWVGDWYLEVGRTPVRLEIRKSFREA